MRSLVPRSIFFAFVLLLLTATPIAAADCEFRLGFKALRDLIGHDIVGECLENERYNAIGDSNQQTTGGLMAWRKADNWTAFTDGYRTWINGPHGLVRRLNTERYFWEADYVDHTPITESIACIPQEDRAYVQAMQIAIKGYETELNKWFAITSEPVGNVPLYGSAEWQRRLSSQSAVYNFTAEIIIAETPDTWQGKAFHAPIAAWVFHITNGVKVYVEITTTLEPSLVEQRLTNEWFPHLDRARLFSDNLTKIEQQTLCS